MPMEFLGRCHVFEAWHREHMDLLHIDEEAVTAELATAQAAVAESDSDNDSSSNQDAADEVSTHDLKHDAHNTL